MTLRITFGNASPSSVATGTQRMPSGARVRSIQPHTVDVPVGAPVTATVEAGHPVRAFPPR